MLKVANTIFEICLLRAAPQDMPCSKTVFGYLLAAHIAVGMLLATSGHSGGAIPAYGLTSTALMLVLARAVLILRSHAERFQQTVSALAGSDVLIGLVAWPVTSWLIRADANGVDISAPLILWFLILLWSLTVTGHILRHALSMHIAAGLAISLGYLVVSYNVMNALFALPG